MSVPLLTLALGSRSPGTGRAAAFCLIRKVGKSGEIRKGIIGNAQINIFHAKCFPELKNALVLQVQFRTRKQTSGTFLFGVLSVNELEIFFFFLKKTIFCRCALAWKLNVFHQNHSKFGFQHKKYKHLKNPAFFSLWWDPFFLSVQKLCEIKARKMSTGNNEMMGPGAADAQICVFLSN